MDNVKNYNYYIQKIRKDMEFIVEHMHNVDIEELHKKLSEGYKLLHGDIPWNAMYDLRNRIVYDYGNVDFEVVFETLKNDIPELLELLLEKG